MRKKEDGEENYSLSNKCGGEVKEMVDRDGGGLS